MFPTIQTALVSDAVGVAPVLVTQAGRVASVHFLLVLPQTQTPLEHILESELHVTPLHRH